MNIFLTLDYELYMGENSGTVQNCLIRPMNKLVEETQDLGARFTVFVDAAYLYRLCQLKEENDTLQRDYDDICKQLKELVSLGHSVQLHIHPQWYFSTYVNGIWQIDQSHYKLSDIPDEKIDELFSRSKNLLEEIIGEKVVAFRAGGYSIQSLNEYSRFLSVHEINIDSSAASGQRYMSNYQWYDYTNISGKRMYHFDSDISTEELAGTMTEYPIASVKIGTIRYILYRLYLKYFKKIGEPFGDGKAVPANRKIKILESRIMNYSFDYVMAPMLSCSLSKLKKMGYEDVVLIGHPKNQSAESIKELRKFILKTNNCATYKEIK